ncbi:MFS transporter [Cypionkella psychrotolerans]|uniref:MFS transporter n=1 Tax=Cypionkella psychrotolerans TaxID=1678131 RepID=UPI0006B42809|nr:MFS transporter [Cypionkella psychrotolerans]
MTGHSPKLVKAASTLPLLVALMVAVFSISVGFGILLPQLPALIERLLGAGGTAAQVSRATGLMTALYMFALFLCAPVWGRLSDQWGRRPVLLIGLAGFAATMIAFAFFETLAAVYVERALSGLFAAAVTPVALAAVTDVSAAKAELGRRLTFVSLAGISGFLLGPTLGVALTRGLDAEIDALALPLVATGGLALIAALAVAVTVRPVPAASVTHPQQAIATAPNVARWLLTLGFVVSAGVAVFEVGLALRGKQELGLTAGQIAAMFTMCSGVMIAVQALVFSPFIKPEFTRWLIAPAFAVMGLGLFVAPIATDFRAMLVVIGAVAASAGILSPILTYWIASHAGHKSGAELGRQTAAASLGAALGSAAGGLLYDVAWLPNAAFVLTAIVVLSAVWPSL